MTRRLHLQLKAVKMWTSGIGKQAWRVLRSYEPGCFPWFLNARECRFLTQALEQAVLVAQRIKESSEFLDEEPDRILTRVQVNGKWVDEWRPWPSPEDGIDYDVLQQDTQVSELRLKRIIKEAKPSGAWEVDISYAPFSVQEGERPYFPRLMLPNVLPLWNGRSEGDGTLSRKSKQLSPRRKRMNRAARLQIASSWLSNYTGNHKIKAYRKHFGVDLACAITELGILGVRLDDACVKQLYQSEQARLSTRQRAKSLRQSTSEAALWPDSDGYHAVVIGYTSGGMSYGLTWEDVADGDSEE